MKHYTARWKGSESNWRNSTNFIAFEERLTPDQVRALGFQNFIYLAGKGYVGIQPITNLKEILDVMMGLKDKEKVGQVVLCLKNNDIDKEKVKTSLCCKCDKRATCVFDPESMAGDGWREEGSCTASIKKLIMPSLMASGIFLDDEPQRYGNRHRLRTVPFSTLLAQFQYTGEAVADKKPFLGYKWVSPLTIDTTGTVGFYAHEVELHDLDFDLLNKEKQVNSKASQNCRNAAITRKLNPGCEACLFWQKGYKKGKCHRGWHKCWQDKDDNNAYKQTAEGFLTQEKLDQITAAGIVSLGGFDTIKQMLRISGSSFKEGRSEWLVGIPHITSGLKWDGTYVTSRKCRNNPKFWDSTNKKDQVAKLAQLNKEFPRYTEEQLRAKGMVEHEERVDENTVAAFVQFLMWTMNQYELEVQAKDNDGETQYPINSETTLDMMTTNRIQLTGLSAFSSSTSFLLAYRAGTLILRYRHGCRVDISTWEDLRQNMAPCTKYWWREDKPGIYFK